MAQPNADQYFVPTHSKAPIMASVALFTLMIGVATWLNGLMWGKWTFFVGVAGMIAVLFYWFSEVVRESQAGHYNSQVDVSFRMGMIWFIFSEVMFFAAFFGALYYARQLSVPWLGGEGTKYLTGSFLWPDFNPEWPSGGPGNVGGTFETIPAFGLPAINTAILLTSGATITIAHLALRAGNRSVL
jgi:cytochrome c oxidase subunit 3